MANAPLTLSRRHVLGDLYAKCDHVTSVPVFWNDIHGTAVGFVDESAGIYADAFTFHIGEEFCKKLAAGQLLCRFNYEYADDGARKDPKLPRRLRLTSFVLESRQNEKKAATPTEQTAETA